MNETTFENARVGDRVWDFGLGWGNIATVEAVKSCDTQVSVTIDVQFDCRECITYNVQGVFVSVRTLFWDEIKFEAPPRPKRMVKKVVEGWVNIYADGTSACIYETKVEADKGSSGGRRLGGPLFICHEYEVEE